MPMSLEAFQSSLRTSRTVEALSAGLIGEGAEIEGAFGPRRITYADYTASGRALRQVEEFILAEVLPYYANSHTEASYCGARMTTLRREARAQIARCTGADENYTVIFTGSGATAGINRALSLFGFGGAGQEGGRPAVLIGPYEHHSNILPWRESGAEVIEIPEAPVGGPDMDVLEAELLRLRDRPLVLGAFSAASNVTGILTDVDAVTRLLKRHGALALWDYAGGGPYLPIAMAPEADCAKDAVVVSPHKFPGGPGASGVLIIRNAAVRASKPTWPGGGTVSFVSPWGHDYSASLAAREEAGTPNVLGDIRAGLAFAVKDAVGCDFILARDKELARMAFAAWDGHPALRILAADQRDRLPIFAFQVLDRQGAKVHPQLFTRMLSDFHGIQARGGCACAGPYAHRLLGISQARSEGLRASIQAGDEIEKPGWTRLNFSYLMSDETARFIHQSVAELAAEAGERAKLYVADTRTARFRKAG